MQRIATVSTVLIAICVASTAAAGIVYINPGSQVTATETAGRGEARYRISNTNWDQSVLNGAPGGNREINNNLGNTASLNNVWFRYTLSHEAGQGYTMTMVNHGLDQSNPAGTSYTLVWRDDVNPDVTTATFKSRSQLNSQTVTSNGAVHMLLVNAQATSGGSSYMEWDQLSFTAGGQTIIGTLGDMNAPPTSQQRIISTVDFRSFDWQLDGWVRGFRDGSGDESQKFWVNFKDAYVTVIPAPGAALLGVLGLGVAGWVKRRMA